MKQDENSEKKDKLWSTNELMEQIKKSPVYFSRKIADGEFLKGISLSDYLWQLMEKRSMTMGEIVLNSLLSKSYVYQVFNGERMPQRDVLLRIGISMSCSVDELQQLLNLAQLGKLYPKVKRDAAICCCVCQEFSLEETNEFLESIGERALL